MRLIVAGSRTITDEQVLFRALHHWPHLRHPTEIVCGRARGADYLGENWGNCTDIPVKEFPAQWDNHGRKAGYLRNTDMGDYADAALVLWDGESRGSLHMVNYMKKLNKPVYVYNTKEEIYEESVAAV